MRGLDLLGVDIPSLQGHCPPGFYLTPDDRCDNDWSKSIEASQVPEAKKQSDAQAKKQAAARVKAAADAKAKLQALLHVPAATKYKIVKPVVRAPLVAMPKPIAPMPIFAPTPAYAPTPSYAPPPAPTLYESDQEVDVDTSEVGLDCLGTDDPDYVGFDYMALVKGAGGILSGFGGGGDDKGGAAAKAAEDARRKAEESASTMKMALIGVLVVVGIGGIVLLTGRKPPAAVAGA